MEWCGEEERMGKKKDRNGWWIGRIEELEDKVLKKGIRKLGMMKEKRSGEFDIKKGLKVVGEGIGIEGNDENIWVFEFNEKNLEWICELLKRNERVGE